MSGINRAQLGFVLPGKTVIIVSPGEEVADKMPPEMVIEQEGITIFRLQMIDIPRLGDQISLAGLIYVVTQVEWTEIQARALPYHPVLLVEAVKDAGVAVCTDSIPLHSSDPDPNCLGNLPDAREAS